MAMRILDRLLHHATVVIHRRILIRWRFAGYRRAVLEAPDDLADEQVLAIVREAWDDSMDAVEHLAVGFGAYHWRADRAGTARGDLRNAHGGRRAARPPAMQARTG
jgi:hypothetical protein